MLFADAAAAAAAVVPVYVFLIRFLFVVAVISSGGSREGEKHIHEKYYAHTHYSTQLMCVSTNNSSGRQIFTQIHSAVQASVCVFVCFVQIKYANELLIHAHFVLAICGGCMWFFLLLISSSNHLRSCSRNIHRVFFCLCFCLCGCFCYCSFHHSVRSMCVCVCVYVENSHWEKHQWQMKRARIEERKHP